MAHYLFNLVRRDAAPGRVVREQATEFLRVRMWGIDAGEPHRNALAAGDLILVYLGAPERKLLGRAELASAVHDWTPSEAEVYPGDSSGGVLLAQVEEWDPPVPMSTVLSQIDSPDGRADFEAGVVRITADEYETALAVAAGRYGVKTSLSSSNAIDGIGPPENAGFTDASNHASKSALDCQTSVTRHPPGTGPFVWMMNPFALRIASRIGRMPSIISLVAPGI